jgi:hypothetical protein
MTAGRLSLILLGLCAASACTGRVVDLDQTKASRQPAAGIWVDDQRLYWLTVDGSVQSCVKTNCAHTTITYVGDGMVFATVDAGRVYWLSPNGSIFSCPRASCGSKPTLATQDPALSSRRPVRSSASNQFFIHRDYVYWGSEADLYRCPASGCVIPELLASDGNVDYIAFDETCAYWTGANGLRRVPLDASEPPTVLVQAASGRLAVTDDFIYWASEMEIARCSKPDCDDSSSTRLVTPDDTLTGLAGFKIDDKSMYWLEANSLLSCPLPDCAQKVALTTPTVARPIMDDSARFAVDASDIYWLEETDSTGPSIHKTVK